MERMPQPFSEGEVKRIMLQLLSAVSFMHSRWILHRDLKMSNVLYTDKGEIKLAGSAEFEMDGFFRLYHDISFRFWPGATVWRFLCKVNSSCRHSLVPMPRAPVWLLHVRHSHGHVGRRLHLR
jgi:hypothetical protein